MTTFKEGALYITPHYGQIVRVVARDGDDLKTEVIRKFNTAWYNFTYIGTDSQVGRDLFPFTYATLINYLLEGELS